ncbi:hypothetical protein [Xylella fastidiosa]|uniref:hypothetical protein n=1 Tax=Xylella fastidiosa TaxID=2371 RepID=UPI00249F549E|nr:hypothetical protein [Xylella fastidiosa]WGZ32969.1 hypothetical protein O4444_05075 [Xylella fastidiosa subsp. pauca]WGZ35405.1 hypothetical protein O4445_05955 [Xylella fastidiosa subsp. pauca]WGZ37677.1 hypothetical protein O4443_05935 [Xylella fastidiosa subsp. pauca]
MFEFSIRKPSEGMSFKSLDGQSEVSLVSQSLLDEQRAEQAELCVRYKIMKASLSRLQILEEKLRQACSFCGDLELDTFNLRMFEERNAVIDFILEAENRVGLIIRILQERTPVFEGGRYVRNRE